MATAKPSLLPQINRKQRALSTPEGVDLRIVIASFGSRIAAYVLDTIFIYGSIALMTFLLRLLAAGKTDAIPDNFLSGLWLILLFLIRNFWFILFEMGVRGATPGKRIVGIRVIARDGGRLETSSVVVRNLMRDVEVFLPIVFVATLAIAGQGIVYPLLALSWAALFLLLPMLNKDRMRAGDLLGGTWVICAPKVKITSDLHDNAQHISQYFNFSDEQVAVYGIYELQTLEGLLRGRDLKALAMVADTIRTKIGWPEGDDDRVFLQAYYSAVRNRLERNMLFGSKRRDKYDAGLNKF